MGMTFQVGCEVEGTFNGDTIKYLAPVIEDDWMALCNRNARDFAAFLGYPTNHEGCGEAPAKEVKSRILSSMAHPLFETMPTGLPLATCDRMVICGRRDDYIQDKCKALLGFIQRAEAQTDKELKVFWG